MGAMHTPGPWVASERAHTAEPDHTYWHIESNEVDGVAAVDLGAFLSTEDAHLIAAAPEMLAALKIAREFVKSELEVRIASNTIGGDISTLDEADGGMVGEAMQCLDGIEAIIARAEGRTP